MKIKSHPSTASVGFCRKLFSFFGAPITKFWVHLTWRLIYLIVFGITLAQPLCGQISLDLMIWIWSAIIWGENVFVVYLLTEQVKLRRQMRWRCAALIFEFAFLFFMLGFRIFAIPFEFGSVFYGRAIMALFFLFQCYSTLLIYIPMSVTLGPLLVRIRLMIFRDFVNFLILIILVILSCAVVIHVIIYPNYPADKSLYHKAFHRAWFSLFTTDISDLEASPRCRPAEEEMPYCVAGPYSHPSCPVPSWIAYCRNWKIITK